MEVKLLGTGSIYSQRNCASLIIDRKILVDIGPGSIKQLLKEEYDIRNIEVILLTHLHSDHILDFPTFFYNIQVLNPSHKIKIIGPAKTKKKLLNLLKLMDDEVYKGFIKNYIEFIEIGKNTREFLLNEYKITVTEVKHSILAYGYIINNKLGITGDSLLCQGVYDIYHNSKILIADCSLVNENVNHMGYDSIKRLLNAEPDKTIIATHLRDETIKVIENETNERFKIVDDGYTFEI